jgi:hypothetical protein
MISKKLIFQLFICFVPLLALSQNDLKKYKEEADAMRQEVWAWNKPEFKVRTIPAEYANASSVIIAHHLDVNADSRKKASMKGIALMMYRELTMTEILREAVKINDKAAVSEYSEIGFTQLQKKSGFFMDKTTLIYIGVRVIKPNGTIKEINADEIVQIKDDKKEKEAKAAIPDLEPGDIVDYFIAKQTKMSELEKFPPYLFALYDDSPIMHYSIHFEIGKKYAVEYRSYNGAPDVKQSTGEDDANVLDVVKKNIPSIKENNIWIAPYRQLPLIRLNIILGSRNALGYANIRRPGMVYRNQSANEFVEDEKNSIYYAKMASRSNGILNVSGTVSDYVKRLSKQRKNISVDSLAAELYYAYRFDKLLAVNSNMDIQSVIDRAERPFSESGFMFNVGSFFKSEDVENKMVLLTSRFGPEMKSIMSRDDIAYIIAVEGSKQKIFGISDIFSPAFYVPSYFENTQRAITLDIWTSKFATPGKFEEGLINIPVSTAEQNARIEQLTITPVLEQGKLSVKRNTTLRGHYKSDLQKSLVLFEDYYESERKYFGQEYSLIEKFENDRKTKKYADELRTAFAEARKKQKDAFESEIKEWFEQEVTDVKNYKIKNLGVRHNSPDFIYAADFTMNGLVKRAGNNYIIEVGKLQGTPLKIEPAQHKRTLDIHAPFARSIQYELSIQIPEGYSVEGLSNLNKMVKNDCGSFICEATTDGKAVTMKVSKSYNKLFEPAANWDKLIAFIDASVDWSNAKILLKRK